MEFLASVLNCDSGGSILRYRFGCSLEDTRVLIPFVQESPYRVVKNQETGKFGVIGFDSTMLKWEPAPMKNEIRAGFLTKEN